MKLEELTKQQIILLTLLVSFVTSIATGIVTVTLLGQTPPGTTQIVNRILERTIEKVVPDKQGASIVMKEKTVVVKEEDLITKSIENGSKSIVRIYEKPQKQPESDLKKENNNILGDFVGIGTVISADGMMATNSVGLFNWKKYIVSTYDNRIFDMEIVSYGESINLANIITDQKSNEKYIFNPIILSESKNLKLGQSVVAISGESRDIVSVGIVSSIIQDRVAEKENPDKTKDIQSETIKNKTIEIQTTIQPLRIGGVPILNSFGEVIALNVISKDKFILIPSDNINEQIKLFTAESAKSQVKK
ncbi:S1C family serine protease [Patescibacteria group bacterium]|nr:S1C family serine protease [Patescibacteria group bacterium]MBU4057385.1 S1C family serine protease [Patescibacteria group bacterium]MBU4116057.1 S1C family serine protease [Patescibacteria group bacterium]